MIHYNKRYVCIQLSCKTYRGFFVVVFVVFVVDCSYTGSENVHFNSLKTDDNVGNY